MHYKCILTISLNYYGRKQIPKILDIYYEFEFWFLFKYSNLESEDTLSNLHHLITKRFSWKVIFLCAIQILYNRKFKALFLLWAWNTTTSYYQRINTNMYLNVVGNLSNHWLADYQFSVIITIIINTDGFLHGPMDRICRSKVRISVL